MIMEFYGRIKLSRGDVMIFVIAFVTPIIAIVFFVNCVSIVKKLIKGQDVHNQAILNGLVFGFIIFSIIWSALLTE
jgi:hypothetical protein